MTPFLFAKLFLCGFSPKEKSSFGVQRYKATIDKAKRNGRDIDYDTAYEEVIADSCESLLSDGEVIQKLAELRARDEGLFEKIKSFITNLVARIKKNYAGMNPDSYEGNIVRKMVDEAERLKELFADALLDASEARGNVSDLKALDSLNGVRFSDRYQSADVNSDVLSLVEKVENGIFNANEKVYFGTVADSTAKRIYNITGVNVHGFKVAIEARQIEHIIKRHGKRGQADRSMADSTDIAKMDYALKNYDDISPSDKTKAYKQLRDGKTVWSDTVMYEKEIGDKSYYVVQAVPDTKAKTLYIVTAFIGKKGYKKETSQFIDEIIPDATPKSEIANASVSSISQSTKKSNTFDEKIFEDMKSDRDSESFSSRSLLANALESTVQNDIERAKLDEYKSKIQLFDAEQKKLSDLRAKIKELSFAKGKRDVEAIKQLQLEANRTANGVCALCSPPRFTRRG